MTYEAAAALQQLRSIITLYPLRLEVLDELIAHGGPPELLADWYYARGNTHCGLAGTPASPAAIEDFRHALVHAVDSQNLGMLASSTLAFGKSVAALPDGVALDYADQAKAFVDAALACLTTTHTESSLPQGTSRSPQSTIAGRIDQAAELGRRYLEQAVDVPQGVDLGMLHLAVSHALRARGKPTEALSHAQEGLVCFRGRDLHNEVRARIQLAVIALETGQWDALDEQLRLIEAAVRRGHAGAGCAARDRARGAFGVGVRRG